MENCSSQYRVVKNVGENLSSLSSSRQSYASVDANCESGLHWKLSVRYKADAKLQQGAFLNASLPIVASYLVYFCWVECACRKWCRSRNIHPAPDDDRTQSHLALPHLSSWFGSLASCHWCWPGIKWTGSVLGWCQLVCVAPLLFQ